MNAQAFLKSVDSTTMGKQGRIVATTEGVSSPEEAVRKFHLFGGEGWLCTTAAAAIQRLHAAAPPDAAGYPLCGERASGDKSLHLQKSDGGWQLVTLTEESTQAADDVILEEVFSARDGQGDLRYAVYWAAQDVCGQNEIRPVRFRFIGFSTKRGGR